MSKLHFFVFYPKGLFLYNSYPFSENLKKSERENCQKCLKNSVCVKNNLLSRFNAFKTVD
ncbi:MAG: hypothetical protein D3919_08740 [Candidatus Electrothrix sp. AW5]|nr:hypothetical protein [Candidatus Electrothrix gigas]